MSHISFNRVSLVGKELEYIQQTLTHMHLAGDGPFSKQCQKFLEEMLGVPKILLTTSCTHSLEMAALLLDLQPDDEVILPSFTFVSTANAFALHGAKLVFADIRPDTLNLDEKQLESLITPRTRAVIPVHYAGVGCEMDAIMALARKHNFEVVEDNAHGLFGKYKGKYLGTFGGMATQSFHETKNITCGEGGALLINRQEYIERAEIIREKGTNRSRFFRGQVDKYSWVDIGSSYLPSELLAAFLMAQLEQYQQIMEQRRRIWNNYNTQLQGLAAKYGFRQPVVPEYAEQPYHMYYLLMNSLEERQRLIQFMKDRDIVAVFHYQPLNASEMGRRFGSGKGSCPVTEDISDRIIRLPFYISLTDADQARVIDAIRDFFQGSSESAW